MALTYASLQTLVADYLDRSDLTSTLPTFIELAESKFKRRLRHWRMEKRATTDTVGGQRTIGLPNDFLEMRHLKLNTDPVTVLEYVTPQVANTFNSGSSKPGYYTIVGNEIILDDTPDSIYELEMYYYAFDSLSESNTSNWLLEHFPDVYVYGTLLEAEAYLMNDPRLAIWKQGFEEGVNQIIKEAKTTRHSGAPLIMRPM